MFQPLFHKRPLSRPTCAYRRTVRFRKTLIEVLTILIVKERLWVDFHIKGSIGFIYISIHIPFFIHCHTLTSIVIDMLRCLLNISDPGKWKTTQDFVFFLKRNVVIAKQNTSPTKMPQNIVRVKTSLLTSYIIIFYIFISRTTVHIICCGY